MPRSYYRGPRTFSVGDRELFSLICECDVSALQGEPERAALQVTEPEVPLGKARHSLAVSLSPLPVAKGWDAVQCLPAVLGSEGSREGQRKRGRHPPGQWGRGLRAAAVIAGDKTEKRTM